MSVIILSRPIRTGKTTELLQWCSHQQNVAGIAMPDINGMRHFQNIATGEIFQAEANEQDKQVIEVGRYRFSKTAFEKAAMMITHELEGNSTTIVIDEIGKLELNNQGLQAATQLALQQFDKPGNRNQLIIVVREELVQQVIESFNITHYIVVDHLL